MEMLAGWDRRLFLLVNNGMAGVPGLQYLFAWPTELGEWYALLLFAAVLVAIWDGRRWMRTMALLGVAVSLAAAVSSMLKELFARPRPLDALRESMLWGEVWAQFYFGRIESWSFPSGHAAHTAAAASVLTELYGPRLAPLWLAVVWIGLTRIYVGAHFPADVLAGALLGLVCGVLTVRLGRRMPGLGLRDFLP